MFITDWSFLLIFASFWAPVFSTYHFKFPASLNNDNFDSKLGYSTGKFDQIVNHLSSNEDRTFQQRYFFNEKFTTPNRSLAYLFVSDNTNQSVLLTGENSTFLKSAEEFGAMVFVLEHRNYGASKVFDATDDYALGYFHAYHAVQDISTFIDYANSQSEFHLDPSVRWILWGSGYGGFLAAEAREAFPRQIEGVVASSAPMKLQYDFWEYNDHVEKAILQLGGSECHTKIKQGFQNISNLMMHVYGRTLISKTFHLDPIFRDTDEDYNSIQMFYLAAIAPFQQIVEYNNNFNLSITQMCETVLNESLTPLESIYAVYKYLSLSVIGKVPPMDTSYFEMTDSLGYEILQNPYKDLRLWQYQLCSQFGWFQTTNTNENSFFGAVVPTSLFINQCSDIFPKSKFTAPIIESSTVFNNQLYNGFGGTNAVFTHGSMDPWIRLGKISNSLEKSVVVHIIENGSHSQDLFPGNENVDVKAARSVIRENIKKWTTGPKNQAHSPFVVNSWKQPELLEIGKFGVFKQIEKTYSKPSFERKMLMGRLPEGFLPIPVSSKRLVLEVGTIQQKVDHFNESDTRRFSQKFYKNIRFTKPGGPHFLWIGGEAPANGTWIGNPDLPLLKFAEMYGATIYMLEHRYYGDSVVGDNSDLTHLTTLQSLYDIANFINSSQIQSSQHSQKWITFGASYAGSLATWTRQLFPKLVIGAVASSPLIELRTDFFEYLNNLETSIRSYNNNCANRIRDGFRAIQQWMLNAKGRRLLNDHFRLQPRFDQKEDISLTDQHYFYMNLISNFHMAVQYNKVNRETFGLKEMCDLINDEGKNPVAAIASFVDYVETFFDSSQSSSNSNNYQDLVTYLKSYGPQAEADRLWQWQICTEFGNFQTADSGSGIFGSALPINFYIQLCQDVFGEKYDRNFLEEQVKINKLRYGWANNNKPSNLFLTSGSLDPWKFPIVSANMHKTAHSANIYPEKNTQEYDIGRSNFLIGKEIGKWLGKAPVEIETKDPETLKDIKMAGNARDLGVWALTMIAIVLIVN